MKHVVIIGGGFLGVYCAQQLEKDFHVTLIDSKDYFEFTPGILRTIVDPGHIKKVQVLHTHYLKKAQVIREKVQEITDKEVILSDKKLPYDYLVLGMGSAYASDIKQENVIQSARAEVLRKAHKQLVDAKRIVIIGGGLVGIELAAEIVEYFKEKHVVLIHSRDRLIHRNTPKASAYTEKFLKKRGTEIVYNERVADIQEDHVMTKSGKRFDADLVFLCVGIKPNTDLLRLHFPDSVNERGAAKVNQHLQVQGYGHIFSAGDIAAIKEEKTAQSAEKAGKVIVENIRRLERQEALLHYTPKSRPMVISLGKKFGILTYNGKTITGPVPGMLKALVEWKTMRRYR